MDAGDVAAVQLRLKKADDQAIRDATRSLKPLVHKRDIAFIMNDRADLAAELDCDGVHIGQGDHDIHSARQHVGPDRSVGVSAEDSRHLAMVAAEAGADYVAFGPMFPTRTKDTGDRAAPRELLSWWAALMEVPSVAIGGITAENCGPLVSAGADFLAVISAVWDHPDGPAAAVRALNEAIEAAPQPEAVLPR